LEIGRVVAGKASSRGACRPASGHAVRGMSERGPVINQGPLCVAAAGLLLLVAMQ